MPDNSISRVAIIGFGEAGGIFAKDLAARGIDVSVFDILFNSTRQRQPMLKKAKACGVAAARNLKECVENAELVISAVTASSDLDVARDVGRILGKGQIFLDINSVSPETKRKAAGHFARIGARYVEAAVMSPVPPKAVTSSHVAG